MHGQNFLQNEKTYGVRRRLVHDDHLDCVGAGKHEVTYFGIFAITQVRLRGMLCRNRLYDHRGMP